MKVANSGLLLFEVGASNDALVNAFPTMTDCQKETVYRDYLRKFGKRYPACKSFQLHFCLFQKTMEEIRVHNLDKSQSWQMGINQFTDMTDQERQRYLNPISVV